MSSVPPLSENRQSMLAFPAIWRRPSGGGQPWADPRAVAVSNLAEQAGPAKIA